MPKKIRKFYNFMNLSYSSSIDVVQEREKIMINILQAKAVKNNKSYDDKINEVVISAKGIVDYIEKNGVPNKKDNLFSTSNSSLFYKLIMLFAVIMVLGFSIYSLI